MPWKILSIGMLEWRMGHNQRDLVLYDDHSIGTPFASAARGARLVFVARFETKAASSAAFRLEGAKGRRPVHGWGSRAWVQRGGPASVSGPPRQNFGGG
jgi:hypothetical protein